MPFTANRTKLLGLLVFLISFAALSFAATPAGAAGSSRETVLKLVEQIKHADYAGDRPELGRLHEKLTPLIVEKDLAVPVYYWRGFAM